jgi:hypothetical protein
MGMLANVVFFKEKGYTTRTDRKNGRTGGGTEEAENESRAASYVHSKTLLYACIRTSLRLRPPNCVGYCGCTSHRALEIRVLLKP